MVERIYSCFPLKSDVCLLQSQHQNPPEYGALQADWLKLCNSNALWEGEGTEPHDR